MCITFEQSLLQIITFLTKYVLTKLNVNMKI